MACISHLSLTPLKDVYFEQLRDFDNVKHGDKTVVLYFSFYCYVNTFIACINFMNLSTIRAVERSKEVGLRKVLGALRNNLVWQFIGESILLTAISCILSVGLLLLLMPWYNQLLGYYINCFMEYVAYLFISCWCYYYRWIFSRQLSCIFSFCIFTDTGIKRKIKIGQRRLSFQAGIGGCSIQHFCFSDCGHYHHYKANELCKK